jgi:hypothetical protein
MTPPSLKRSFFKSEREEMLSKSHASTRPSWSAPIGRIAEFQRGSWPRKKKWQGDDAIKLETAIIPTTPSTLIDFGDLQPCDNHRTLDTGNSPNVPRSTTTTTASMKKWLTESLVTTDHDSGAFEKAISNPEQTHESSHYELFNETAPSANQSAGSADNTKSSQDDSGGLLLEQYECQAEVFCGHIVTHNTKDVASLVATMESGSTLSGQSKSFDVEDHRTGPPSYGKEIQESFSADSRNLDGSKTSSDSSVTSELVPKWDTDNKGKERKVLTKVQQRKEKLKRMEKES